MKPSDDRLTRRLWALGGVALIIVAPLAIGARLADEAGEPKAATAAVRVGPPRVLEGDAPRDASWDVQYRRTQVLLLKSDLVLGAALREEGILDLPVLKGAKETPKQWL